MEKGLSIGWYDDEDGIEVDIVGTTGVGGDGQGWKFGEVEMWGLKVKYTGVARLRW